MKSAFNGTGQLDSEYIPSNHRIRMQNDPADRHSRMEYFSLPLSLTLSSAGPFRWAFLNTISSITCAESISRCYPVSLAFSVCANAKLQFRFGSEQSARICSPRNERSMRKMNMKMYSVSEAALFCAQKYSALGLFIAFASHRCCR